MDGKHIFNIDKWDEISYEYGTLKIEDTANVIEIKGAEDITRKIVDTYMQQADDIKRDEIWKGLYDEPSYKDLERENLRLKNELEQLGNSYETKNEQYQNLKYRR